MLELLESILVTIAPFMILAFCIAGFCIIAELVDIAITIWENITGKDFDKTLRPWEDD